MNAPPTRHRPDVGRFLAWCGVIGCGLVWGLVELFALQRSRYQARRGRHRAVWNR